MKEEEERKRKEEEQRRREEEQRKKEEAIAKKLMEEQRRRKQWQAIDDTAELDGLPKNEFRIVSHQPDVYNAYRELTAFTRG